MTKIYIDTSGIQLGGEWLNIDVNYMFLPTGKNSIVDIPTDGKSDVVVISRFFERLPEEKINKFLIDLRKSLSDKGLVYLYSMHHDGCMSHMRGQNGMQEVFGKMWDKTNNWLRDYRKPQAVIDIFEDYGFEYVGNFTEDLVENVQYPCHRLIFKKMEFVPPSKYILGRLDIKPYGKVIDIGPGNHPFPGAYTVLEHESRKSNPAYSNDNLASDVVWGDIQNYNPTILDHEFDFAWCSHVLEHVDDPIRAIHELQRIATAGAIILPSVYKDSLTFFEEEDHKWNIMEVDGKVIFVKRRIHPVLRDKDCQAISAKLYREHNYETRDNRYIKKWFKKNEALFDIVLTWNKERNLDNRIQVIG